MKWPGIRDIFAFKPPADAGAFLPVEDDDLSASADASDGTRNEGEARWQKVRFDNTIRLWVSIPTYLICIALWAGGAMAELFPMSIVFGLYVVVQFIAATIFMNTRLSRGGDLFLSGLDLAAMSFSIYYTGGVSSPLYFIYFVPLIVHAFHRDWHLILFNGFGGVVLYGMAVLMSLTEVRPAALADLAARLVFMLLTVAIACIALNLLRRKDEQDRKRIARLRAVSVLMHRLNRTCATRDLGPMLSDMAPLLSVAIGGERSVYVRALFRTDGTSMRLGGDPHGYAVALAACPALEKQTCISDDPSDAAFECHWEAPAVARFCVPIAISSGEVFGVLSVGSREPGSFTGEEQEFIRFVSKSIALCAHRLQQMDELRRAVEMGSCVTAAYLASAHSMPATMQAVIEGALALVDADQASIFLWNNATGRLESTLTQGERAADETGLSFGIGEGIVGWTFETREPRWTSNVQEDAAYRARRSGIKSLLAVPLQTIKGEVLGVLTISRLANRAEFQEDEIAVASTFAHRAAHALRAAEMKESAFRRLDPPHAQAA
jgi:GAF domain-containing protein